MIKVCSAKDSLYIFIRRSIRIQAEIEDLRFRFRRSDGNEIELEGSEDEVGEKIDSFFNKVSALFSTPAAPENRRNDQPMNIEALSRVRGEKDGLPILATKVGSRKGIGLLLYPETALSSEQLERSLGQSGIPTKGRFLLSRLSELRKNGYVVKGEDATWGLTPLGRKWIEEKIAPSLRVDDH